MNRKQFILLLVLVAIVGAAGLIIHRRGRQSWQSAGQTIGQKLLPALSVNDIAQITIKSGTNELNLAKRDDFWRVRERGDYLANFAQISELLLKFADLKIAQTEEVGPSQLARFELLPPGAGANTGTQVDFKDATGKTRNSVLLGKKHMKKMPGNPQFAGLGDEGWPDGRYVMAGGGATTLALVSDPLDSVQPKPESWLNKDFFSIEKPRSLAVQFPEATNSWKLTRASETNDWQLADAKAEEKLDSSKISGVTNPFSSASFNDVLPAATQPEISGLTNVTVVTVETFDGFTYTVKIGQKRNEDFPVAVTLTAHFPSARDPGQDEKPEAKARLDAAFNAQQQKLADKLTAEKHLENWVYFLPAFSLDSILKPKNQLLVEAPKPSPAK